MHATRRQFVVGAAAVAAALPTIAAGAEGFPSRQIRFVVPFSAGGATDVLARLVAGGVSRLLGQPVIVENLTGAGGVIGASSVVRAPADGYAYYIGSIGFNVMQPLIGQLESGFEPDKVLTPVAYLASIRMLLVANPNSSIRNAEDLVAKANTQKGVTYGTAGTTSSTHLTIEVLKSEGKLNLIHAPYRGEMPAMQDVVEGTLDLAVVSEMGSRPYIQAGKVRPVMVLHPQRFASMPAVASVSELFPGISIDPWFGLYARVGTPASILDRVAQAVQTVLSDRSVAQSLEERGFVLRPSGGREQFVTFLNDEATRWESQLRKARLLKSAS